jgi:hypothetical protein
MKRNKVKLFGDGEIEFYIDEENKDNIIDFLKEKGMDKLRHIFWLSIAPSNHKL